MNQEIWTEKYRPKTFSEIKGQKNIIKRIEALVNKGNIPHLIFSGSAGIGKTTTAVVIAQTLFGKTISNNFLELNSSDERGIDVIRNKIKDFARTKSISDVPFKIILLDECDSLTKDAQHALRRTMETYSNNCRFILSCNYLSKVIDPIKSRCAVFKFKPLEKEEIRSIVEMITKNENMRINEKAKDILIELTEGDVRQLNNVLQACSALTTDIDENIIKEVLTEIEPKGIKESLFAIIDEKFLEARDLLLNTMLHHGLNGIDVIKQINKEIWGLQIPIEKKIQMIEKCGEIEFRIVEGSDDFIQLEALLASFMEVNKK
jgi:replication factor C small subunit